MIDLKDIPVLCTSPDDLIPTSHDNYVDVGLLGLLTKLAWTRPIVLKGPKGTGKTLALEEWAARQGVPMVRQDCSDDIGHRDLVGSYGIAGQSAYYGLGSITTAIEVANAEGACLLVLEEVNALNSKAQKMLNGVCDFRQSIEIAKIGKVFKVKPDCKIWVVGTMNPNYSGTYALNEDFRSRWGFVHVGHMSPDKESDILHHAFKDYGANLDSRTQGNLVRSVLHLALESRTSKLGDYQLSTRDLVHLVSDITRVQIGGALKILEGKFEDDDAIKAYRAVCRSKFGVELADFELFTV